LSGESFSDIERQIKRLRRQAALDDLDLRDLFPILIRRHIDGQTKASKKEIAIRLTETGLSQRAVNELTGISRDTLRKLNNSK
jgi:DNA invertase Pin-like site-specific DNA recombinase